MPMQQQNRMIDMPMPSKNQKRSTQKYVNSNNNNMQNTNSVEMM